jgi:NADPH:quinone reductase-like Zn-dependent oxidoreductase
MGLEGRCLNPLLPMNTVRWTQPTRFLGRLTRVYSTIQPNMANRAAWQKEKGGPLTVSAADLWEPEPGEVRIKVHAAAVQPAEAKIGLQGVIPLTQPAILGTTCAGVVDKLGEGVTKVQVGDRVCAGLDNYARRGDPARASLQRFTLANEAEVIEIGPDLAFANAVAANSQQPANGLYKLLGLQYPSDRSNSEPKNESILIWGGSGAMGYLSIKYAKLAGYRVLTTASPHNFQLVQDAGADEVFDRNDPLIFDKLKAHLPIKFWFDTVALPETISVMYQLAAAQRASSGQDVKILTLMPTGSDAYPKAPEGVVAQFLLFRNKLEENAAHVAWLMGKGGFLEKGLKSGVIRGVPAEVVGGLEQVQAACERVLAGQVSATKIVIDPWRE